ncbi:beta-galactosidase [Microbacterium sp. EYE_5]|uniref:glycoside hydrolase family 35 protein n=1 Tax=unclassified Microbacterium TaxID=2609290 RepID=UPI002003C157|nr:MULTISPECIES: beta-galactosidase family protein [unclassified Microbacterium]MCK6080209.1 beta-galactosidase [Microbacterium sp. EYE_382]MCK6085480.1 beta-galactosidase [Microbacterium sp. EYE_384]MCK6122295.1 beta-galactosidase [Microbacterium sp. EYE_80]MCK6126243.1 beta-galactosidase [Microbacterium sp. EYE_79]MCK6141164.1 beta-galactosidase [Microbacterium sp. EYE_39]
MSDFRIGDEHFELDGRPFRILSGALHYFRVHPDQWRDRIRKAKQMGLNTIETYVAWNAHAPQEGVFDLSGQLDLARFLDEVHDEGMYAIVRPGPYICAEWDGGGLPAWLFRSGTVGVRRNEPQFMAAVETYLRALGEVFVPRQIDRGGPIILVQIENEYGAYGSDASYLRALVDITRDSGITVPLTTVDQPTPEMLEAGSIPGLHKTASFGSRSRERLATLREHQPTGPLMCSEFWDGWFDSWGGHHHTTTPEESAQDLADLLEAGASVNLYMFHGGTSFGFTNGANDKGVYSPLVTSYDYDAPLDETGAPTAKYAAFREVLARFTDVADALPAPRPAAPTPAATITETVALADVVDELGQWHTSEHPPSMDDLGAFTGFAVYRTRVRTEGREVLHIDEIRDRALVSVDGAPVGVLARDHHDTALALPADAAGVLELLVEDQGRVNYGVRIGEPKGLIGRARVGDRPLTDWQVLPLDLASIGLVRRALDATTGGALAGPAFGRARFSLDEPADLFLDTRSWGKGVAWMNGFNLGRYWTRGPQHTLFVPASSTRAGDNELIVFELHGGSSDVVFSPHPDLGHLEY